MADRIRTRIDSLIERITAGELIDYDCETVLAGWEFVADSMDRHEAEDEQLATIAAGG